MKFDFNKLKEINDLDFEQVAIWPFEVKTLVAVVLCIFVAIGGFYGLVKDKLPILEEAQAKEGELKLVFEAKNRIAVNLLAYKDQLARIEADFSSMLKSLPTSNETPGLLDDITFVGTSSGLTFKLLNWQRDIPKEFYTELPIEIEVTGDYHEFGQFSAKMAALPRIVTVHDFNMEAQDGTLTLKLQAKTYRTDNANQTDKKGENK